MSGPIRAAVCAAVLSGSWGALSGCASNDPAFESIKSNPSPELIGMANRYVDTERNMAMVGDQNLRMMWNDLNRLWLFDGPSTLSPWNTVSTTGQP